MLDIKLIRENPEVIKASQRKRGESTEIVDECSRYDVLWREALQKGDELKHKRNVVSAQIPRMKDESEKKKKIEEMRSLVSEINDNDKKIQEYKENREKLLMRIPNILHESVPIGKDENDNVEIKRWGEIPKFDFEPKGHLELGIELGLIDQERGAKVAGAGFYYLKGELALLDFALMKFTIDLLVKRKYVPVEPPLMLRRRPYEGVTDLADYEIIDRKDLPLRFIGISSCFRREIGAHGKYTKGLFRMHQFNKIEQFIFCHPDDSWKYHEELQKNAEDLYQAFEIPYRVVNVCTGDIGSIAAKKYDIEVWMADGAYREAGSNSNCTEYQARRLNTRYQDGETRSYVHTLNNTAIATSRTMLAIIESHQNKDGSITIPKVLRPLMNGLKKIE
jgi:seryl-tRNA synthetase